jgi:hypothetical protein
LTVWDVDTGFFMSAVELIQAEDRRSEQEARRAR